MIAFLRGKLASESDGSVVLDVNGVGYRVFVPGSTLTTLPEIGQEVFLLTHMIVREDGMQLYGFKSEDELTVFSAILNVAGVGPKGALAVLSVYQPTAVKTIITNEDVQGLVKVPGIGKKTAQRLILELKDKLKTISQSIEYSSSENMPGSNRTDAEFALLALGYNQSEAQDAVSRAAVIQPPPANTGELIKIALKYLMKR